MFKKPESAVKKHTSLDATKNVASLDAQKSLMEKIRTDRVQYELTDTGISLNPYRFLSLKSILRDRTNMRQPSEPQAPSESIYAPKGV